ncbi:hypothetical protein [Clostridium culturomicium]|uniref:hypothetical protein n=1 Tax=Clostridium culturomicium TaxID=1499683 RepID=UPI0038578C27
MQMLSFLRFFQILFCFPIIILFTTSTMNELAQIIFIVLFTLYTAVYELILLKYSKRKRRRTTSDSSSSFD